jgi:glycerol kinase
LSTTKEQIVSALLESILFRVYDNLILKDCQDLTAIFADGGMTKNPQLMQYQSDIISKPVTVR